MKYPSSNEAYPIESYKGVCFLKNIIKSRNIIVGDYTYYDDQQGDVYRFEKNVLYLFDFLDEKLIIGKFCQLASDVRFIMSGANHFMEGFSTYPFHVFANAHSPEEVRVSSINMPRKGNTVIGNDVWIGNSATIMPGVRIGDGAIIGTNALVTKEVEPYSIVGGNPAQLIRKRFDDKTIDFLLQLAWWDWDIETITNNLSAIMTGDMESLRKISLKMEG